MSIDDEIARRNYALTTATFDCEHLVQISCGGEILATVCNPNGHPDYFAVFNGNGLDDEDNDLGHEHAIKLFDTLDEQDAWRQAVRYGYLHALGKMMTADKRLEDEALTRAFA